MWYHWVIILNHDGSLQWRIINNALLFNASTRVRGAWHLCHIFLALSFVVHLYNVVMGNTNARVCLLMSLEASSGVGCGGRSGGRSRISGLLLVVVLSGMKDLVNGGLQLGVVWSRWTVVFLVGGPLAAVEDAADLLELLEGLHGECGHAVVGGLGVVDLVDRHGGVHDFGLHSLLVDDGLHGFVDVVVDVLAHDLGCGRFGVLRFVGGGGVGELADFGGHASLDGVVVAVVEFSAFHWYQVVGVLLGQDFFVGNRLDCGVVVVLVHLTVDCLCGFLVAVRLDGLTGHRRLDNLFDLGVMTLSVSELVNSFFGGLHCDRILLIRALMVKNLLC